MTTRWEYLKSFQLPQFRRQTVSEQAYIHTTVGEYCQGHPTMTPSSMVDANGNPLDPDTLITISEDHNEYCVGRYDGNQTWLRMS